ncbi:MAG: excinuclease ABC subunit UvrA [Planctomycetota bacterium]
MGRTTTGGAIQIRGARQNNLAGFDLTIPRDRLVAITGVSGSGKSSLAFDTLFREGQRRFLETLSAYARQFLGRMEKPAVDHVEGLAPAIAVDQRAVLRGPRSTVGTITEIIDHLRVLFARAGIAHCPDHGEPLESRTRESIVAAVRELFGDEPIHVLAPVVRDRKGEHKALLADLARQGFVRVRVDGEVRRIEEVGDLARYRRHTIDVVVDRLRGGPGGAGRAAGAGGTAGMDRLREAIDAALELAKGDCIVLSPARERAFSTLRTCPACGAEAPPLEPRLFSFNSPHGACPACDGLGTLRRPSERAVIADPRASIRAGALAVTRASGGGLAFPRVDFAFLAGVAAAHGFDLDTPWQDLPPAARRVVLRGTGEERFPDRFAWQGTRTQGAVRFQRRFPGVLAALESAGRRGPHRAHVERYLDLESCPDCGGSRLNRFAAAVRVGGRGLGELARMPIADLGAALSALPLTAREAKIAEGLRAEIHRRLAFLTGVGLGYLTLDRSADSLSSGEAQRIRLAAQLGAGLQGVLYVLDEPSIGLHARDQGRLLAALFALRDAGNTVIVVEHDEATLRAADLIVDIGPGPGRHGGRVSAQGTPAEVARADTPTGELLRGELVMPRPEARRRGRGALVVRGARGFNLQGIDVAFPLGTFTVVSGVSGSGKSTLVHHTLQRALARHLGREAPPPEPCAGVDGLEQVEDLVFIDGTPIGRTPRSNPATYSGAFTPIRDLYASLPEARLRGWKPGRFSFNVEGGRCGACGGAGVELVELQFLAPVTVPCEDCGGHRFRPETLDVLYRGRSIADVLALTIEEASELFADLPKIARPLAALAEVGLGYLALGQPSTTLSGGEAQRVKLAKHLQRRSARPTVYLLDEPTTGLHAKDVQRLVGALQALVDRGHTVIVIEHDLRVIESADFVIDLGPEGGDRGGRLVGAGTPEEIESLPGSHTAAALRAAARGAPPPAPAAAPGALLPPPAAGDRIVVRNARIHNLRHVDVDLPREALIVVTGPSGSGKSSLALDTIHATGRQRFVESLPTYARQFLAARDRPPVDRLEGLGPSVAVEAGTAAGHPRSTVATTTEIHDHLRVLWARAGTRRCPAHGEELVRRDASAVARQILREAGAERGWIVAPIFGPGHEEPADLAAAFAARAAAWKAAGFVRVLAGGQELRLDGAPALPPGTKEVDLVIDRLAFAPAARARVAEAVEGAEALAGGRVAVQLAGGGRRLDFATLGLCPRCGFRLAEELEPRHFSFNTHVGACPACAGLGESWTADPALLVDHPERPLVAAEEGSPTAIGGKLGRYLTKGKGYYEHLLRRVAAAHQIDLARPFRSLSKAARDLLLFGRGARPDYRVQIAKGGATYDLEESFTAPWAGLCGHVDAWHAKAEDPEWRAILEGFMRRTRCAECGGERLASAPRAVTLGKKRLPELLAMSVHEVAEWLARAPFSAGARAAVGPVLAELAARVGLLERVGLGYLTLDRPVATLSSGEARRVRLSASLGSELVGVCYVLDEPTVGLHPCDVDRLTDALLALRDGGNTVIVVEHDESLMRRADHIVDMGPGAGARGGTVVVSGPPAAVEACPESPTGQTLRGEIALPLAPAAPRGATREEVRLAGARLHNLRGIELAAGFGEITGVCGPSGSGKSTLVLDCLVPALRGEPPAGRWRRIDGGGRRVVVVDATPLGRTPASIPATAVGLLAPLRDLYARTPEARRRGFTASHFSFNSPRGRCPACEGRGATKVEMQFLADLWLPCEECDGRRYLPEVLGVTWRGRSIADVLALPVDAAAEFLAEVPGPAGILATLRAVGLGYLPLDQSSTTLSAGEAQRVKLAAELLRADGTGRAIVVLDEPTTGLHKTDVVHLFAVLRRLAERGDAVIVIEHHVDLLNACDRLVELGPGGGEAGGLVIAAGPPAALAADPDSVTGPWLAAARRAPPAPARAASAPPRARARRRTEVAP